ncbi:50S ribosomal protein L18 [Pseudomonadota bacterium]
MTLKRAVEKRKKRTKYRVNKFNKNNRPVLVVCRTNKNISAQVIDVSGNVLAALSSSSKAFKDKLKKKKGVEIASIVGREFGKLALKNNIKEVVFNKGPYMYIGRVKAFADGCREAGLVF